MPSPIVFDWERLDALFFDFDGVIVDSVPLKTQAYREIFRPFGAEAVEYVDAYHREHGGVDRHRKIRHVLEKFSLDANLAGDLAERFARLVKEKVVAADLIPTSVDWLRSARERGRPCFVVSGTPEDELREIVRRKQLAEYFLAVRGSPATKEEILSDLLLRHSIDPLRAIFVGDACTDLRAAQSFRMSFIGIPPNGGEESA